MEMLKANADFSLLHVPYTGAGPAVLALLSNQVHAVSTGPASILQQIKAGKTRALAHWGDGRLASLPDVPSLKELGYPVEFSQWSGLFVPAGTAEPIIAKLRAAARQAAADANVQQVIQSAGSPILYLDAPEFQRFWDVDEKKMSEVVKRIGRID